MTHDIIVKQRGGRIDVATEPGQFTEFTTSCRAPAQGNNIWKATMSTYIVVVDDEPDLEEMFKQHFRRDFGALRKRRST